MDKIEIQNLYKIFGPDPQKAISLLQQGHDKNAVLEKTGMSVDVNGTSFKIKVSNDNL
jgi:glycine betaine/proline transport system ATP-binding protein